MCAYQKLLVKTSLATLRGLLVILALFAVVAPSRAGWLDDLLKPSRPSSASPSAPSLTSLSQAQLIEGLKQALSQGVQQAVAQLGQEGGFLNNLRVKIPMPENLQIVARGLRAAGQNRLADDFVVTLNRAAEKAVPEAASVFADALSQMTIADAQSILSGPNDAATQYFRRTSEARLTEKFLPIVRTATAKVGVTSAYKNLVAKAGPVTQFLGGNAGDLDAYVTRKALDGLFTMVAAEEKRIRENPAARATDLLEKVFGNR